MSDLCHCVDVSVGSYAHIVLMQDPFTEKLVGIDVCIATEIAELWHQGIRTMASCCGHGTYPASVSVLPSDDAVMARLGFELSTDEGFESPKIWRLR